MKFFSLLSHEEVHPSTEEKVISGKDYIKLKKANDILSQVKQEAHDFKKQVVEETEILQKQAVEEGFQEGLDRCNQALFFLDQELKNSKEEFQKKILPIALQAAKKILGEELKLHPDRIVDIVSQALKPVLQHHRIKIYAHKDDIAILEKNKPRIRELLEQVESFALEERDDVQSGGCIIETEAGIINAQLENQWRSLEAAFRSYMEKQQP